MHSVYTLYLPLVYHARTTHPHAHTHRDTQRCTEAYRDTQTRTHPHAHAHRVREVQTHILLSGARNIHTHTLPPRLHRGTHRSIQRFTEAHAFQLGIYTPHTYKSIVVLFYLHNPNCELYLYRVYTFILFYCTSLQ